MSSRTLWWPVALMVLAITLLVSGYIVAIWNNPRALALPIPLLPGYVQSAPFQVDQSLAYLIEFEVERGLPFNELQCLLGEQPEDMDCGGTSNVVNLQWRIFQGDKTVATGASRPRSGAGYGPTIAKIIGEFDAIPDLSYILEVRVLGSLEELRPTQPRVVVDLHPIDRMDSIVLAALLGYPGLLLLLGSVIWLLVRIVSLRRSTNATYSLLKRRARLKQYVIIIVA